MFITVTNRFGNYPIDARSQLFLSWDEWNDYSFKTFFGIFYVDENLKKHNLGGIKIGWFDQKINERKIIIGDRFEKLNNLFFSIGTDVEYYERLNSLNEDIKIKILNSLNDIAKNVALFKKVKKEEVYRVSFLRDLNEITITNQFRRIINNDAKLTPFNFSFESEDNFLLEFNVEPNSMPPSNIHIIIGRNGVGKSHLINNMVNTLQGSNNSKSKFVNSRKDQRIFSNLICVSFSAFDDFENIGEIRDKSTQISYHYVGQKSTFEENNNINIYNNISEKLAIDFSQSLWKCFKSLKKYRWISIMEILESDPIFKNIDIKSIANIDFTNKNFKEFILEEFKKLSSGHKIILLTLTKLVEKTEERSLILLDEPESHLHPPLLSSFIRAISELLINKNGVAIIATHSPVILQEVPTSCVWKLRRNGKITIPERPRIQTFGENVGILTNEIFGLEVSNSGYNKILEELVNRNPNYETAIDRINNEIGLEAKAILRTMFYEKNQADD